MAAMIATTRRHLARLMSRWPTRRQIARCGHTWHPVNRPSPPPLIEEPPCAELLEATTPADLADRAHLRRPDHGRDSPHPTAEPKPSDHRAELAAILEARPLACPTCGADDFFASRAHPGRYRCRACGDTTET